MTKVKIGNTALKKGLLKRKGNIKKFSKDLGISTVSLYKRINTTPMLKDALSSLRLSQKIAHLAIPEKGEEHDLRVENILKVAEKALIVQLKAGNGLLIKFVCETLGAKKYSAEVSVQTKKEFTVSFKSTPIPMTDVIDVKED